MNEINILNKLYDQALSSSELDYKFKVTRLMNLCNEINKESINIKTSSLKQFLNEVQKISTLITNIHLNDKSQEEKENLLEHCRLMIEVHLGQALVLEMESNKR